MLAHPLHHWILACMILAWHHLLPEKDMCTFEPRLADWCLAAAVLPSAPPLVLSPPKASPARESQSPSQAPQVSCLPCSCSCPRPDKPSLLACSDGLVCAQQCPYAAWPRMLWMQG